MMSSYNTVVVVKSSSSSISTASDNINNDANDSGNCCPRDHVPSELRLYQAFVFAMPVLFAFIILLLFYFFYIGRRRVDWRSLRMRTVVVESTSESSDDGDDDISRCELGLKKELREMLPIIVFRESFSIKDTQCSVCLGDYQAEDKLQQIPTCGHSFHMHCIDLWLVTHTTCPLCRESLLASSKSSCQHGGGELDDTHVETSDMTCEAQVQHDETSDQSGLQSNEEDTRTSPQPSQFGDRDGERVLQIVCGTRIDVNQAERE